MIGFIINMFAAMLNVFIGSLVMSAGGDPTVSFIFAGISVLFAFGFLFYDLFA